MDTGAFIHTTDKERQQRDRLIFIWSCIGLALVFFFIAVGLGHRLLVSKHLLHDVILFGSDSLRNIQTFAEPHMDDRSNVHPLLGVTVKPLAFMVQGFNISRPMSAVIVNALAATLGLLLTALYLRMRGVSRLGTLLGMALMGASATWMFAAPIPGSYIFHIWVLAALNILLVWTLREPIVPRETMLWREGLWLAAGVINYGYTVTCGIYSFIVYAFSRSGLKGIIRAIGYGGAVLAIGLALTWAVGSSFDMLGESRWVVDKEFHGTGEQHPFLDSLSCHLVWSVVSPSLTDGVLPDNMVIKTIRTWDYSAISWLIAAGWIAILFASIWAAIAQRDRTNRALNLALAACLAFQIIFHTFYYATGEGLFNYVGHVFFALIGLTAPLLLRIDRHAKSRVIYAALAAFILLLAAKHIWMCYNFPVTIPLPK